eukprot:12416372-Karenia_brevis.AAC.1
MVDAEPLVPGASSSTTVDPDATSAISSQYMLHFNEDHAFLRDEDDLEQGPMFPSEPYAFIAWYESQTAVLLHHYPLLEQMYYDARALRDRDRRVA